MVNIEQITSTLAKLPDQALQRYAMMHKDDPYIMSLAVSESKRRKEMRSAGQQQMQPQPKVVDQAVAEMAAMPSMPEEQGIGALPAAARMNFADGGITGYAGGGEVERYQSQGLVQPYERPYDRMNRLNREAAARDQAAREAAAKVLPYGGVYSGDGQYSAEPISAAEMGETDPYAALKKFSAWAGRNLEVDPSTGQMVTKSEAPSTPTAAEAAPVYAQPQDTRKKLIEAERGAALSKDQGRKQTDQMQPSAGRVPAAPAMSIEDRFLAAQKKMTEQPNPFAVQESAVQTEAEKLAADRLAGVKASQEKFKDVFAGRETRLADRAKELEKSKDTNTGLAFLEAGLAIMSTPGGLATAIGKGAREGTAKYAAGIDKLRSAQDKLDDAKDRLEELKLNRAEMSDKELREAELGIQQTVLSGKKDALASAKSLYGDRSVLSQKILETTIGVEQKALDRATQERTAGAAAAIALKPQAEFIADWLAKPENKGKTFSDAYAAFKSVGAASERNDIAGLRAVRTGLAKDLEDLTLDKATKEKKRAEISRIDQQILALSGVNAPSTQGGPQRTIDWTSIK